MSYEFDAAIEEAPRSSYARRNGNGSEKPSVPDFDSIPIGTINIHVPETMEFSKIEKLKQLLSEYPGRYQVCLMVKNGGGVKKIMTSYRADTNNILLEQVRSMFGNESFMVE